MPVSVYLIITLDNKDIKKQAQAVSELLIQF